jgi:hypothetical protein
LAWRWGSDVSGDPPLFRGYASGHLALDDFIIAG